MATESSSRGPLRSLGLRANADLVNELERIAKQNGRSLAMECEMRLAASLKANTDLGALIQKAVADGIAAHEAAKAEKMRAGWVTGPHGTYAAQNVQGGYLGLYGIQDGHNS